MLWASSVALLLGLVTSTVSLAVPGDPSFRGTNGYGFDIQGVSGDPVQAAQEITRLKQEMGASWVRINATWAEIEPTKGTYNWTWGGAGGTSKRHESLAAAV